MNVYVDASTLKDAKFLSLHMRDLDCREVDLAGNSPLEALTKGLELSDECLTAFIDDVPIAMFGVVPFESGGAPWLLCTDRISEVSRRVLRDGRRWVDDQHQKYGYLTNVVYSKHDEALRFIEFMKFDLTKLVEVNGHDFIQFER